MTTTVPTTQTKPRKFPWLIYLIVLAVIVIRTGAPMLAASMVDVIADANGCAMSSSGTNGCVDANGKDLDPLIGQLMLWGWMMILILPVGIIALLVWAIVLVMHLITFSGAARNQVKPS